MLSAALARDFAIQFAGYFPRSIRRFGEKELFKRGLPNIFLLM